MITPTMLPITYSLSHKTSQMLFRIMLMIHERKNSEGRIAGLKYNLRTNNSDLTIKLVSNVYHSSVNKQSVDVSGVCVV